MGNKDISKSVHDFVCCILHTPCEVSKSTLAFELRAFGILPTTEEDVELEKGNQQIMSSGFPRSV
jgi:hypothetical protein